MKPKKTPPVKLNIRLTEELKQQIQAYADSVGISTNTAVVLAIRNFLPYAIQQAQNLRMAPPPNAVFAGSARPKGFTGPAPAAPPINNPSKPPSIQPSDARWRTVAAKMGRNEPCPCGSNKKVKQCHGGPL